MRERHQMSDAAHPVTAQELERFPRDDRRYELVDGQLIPMTPVGAAHAWLVARLLTRLSQHVESEALGLVFTELGFRLASHPDRVRAPDIAFIRRERLPQIGLPRGFWKGPPDLAIEVLSPDDREAEIRAKVEEYHTYGVSLVVVIHPDEKTATVFRPSTPPLTIDADGTLDLSDVVADFQCTVREIFE